MTYPFKTPKEPPYSEFPQNGFHSMKRTKMYCQYCKYSVEVRLYGAKCGQCRSFLITYSPQPVMDDGKLAE